MIKVLHIGFGFIPWHFGGLKEYTEDLMEIQSKNNFDIYYFFPGRHYPFFRKPQIKKYKKNKIKMFELINFPVVTGLDKGTFFPQQEVNEIQTEDFFRKILEEIKPDIIHIHELIGLPSSLIEIAKKEYKIPIIITIQDYFTLCPTIKLFDFNKNNCTEINTGKKCFQCCKNAPKNNNDYIFRTLNYEANNCKNKFIKNILKLNKELFRIYLQINKKISIFTTSDKNKEEIVKQFQKRRDTIIERLKYIDIVVPMSTKVEEIYKKLLNSNNIKKMQLTVKNVDLINTKIIDNTAYPIEFITLTGCSSVEKGGEILQNAIKILNKKGLEEKFNLSIYGSICKETRNILEHKNVNFKGGFNSIDLDKILQNFHVGIVPSIWEEAYGYVGIELIAKGIPVIGNNRGGIVDYTKDNYTGWVNKSCTAQELAKIMENIIYNPEEIQKLNKNIIKDRYYLTKTMQQHFDELNALYCSIINKT